MSILVLAEHAQNKLHSATLHTIAAAQHLGSEITVLVCGHEVKKVAEAAATIAGVVRVLLADAPCYAHLLPENVAPLIAKITRDYAYVLAPSSSFGKNILPRAAMLLNVSMISDVIAIQSQNTFVRPLYAGSAMATVQSDEAIKVMTVRSTAFTASEQKSSPAPIEILSDLFESSHVKFLRAEQSDPTRPELTTAKVVVAGGRALKSAENFKLLECLANILGGAVGASRAAVDAGFVPNDYQVGQTGKIVAPDLYIAVGISGAVQHIAGMKDSKIIVAINQDPEAPIFQIADYGLVGDLFEIIPQLCKALEVHSNE